MLRQLLPDATIGFFHHTPFPAAEVFAILPWREQILASLLDCDLVGFHVPRYQENFVDCACNLAGARRIASSPVGDRFLTTGAALATASTTSIIDHPVHGRVRLGAFPVGIDVAALDKIIASPEHQRRADAIREEIGDRQMILSIERLDYIKGPVEKLLAYEHLLEHSPQYREKIVFVNVLTPPADAIVAYRSVRKEVDHIVGRINGRFATLVVDAGPLLLQAAALRRGPGLVRRRLDRVDHAAPRRPQPGRQGVRRHRRRPGQGADPVGVRRRPGRAQALDRDQPVRAAVDGRRPAPRARDERRREAAPDEPDERDRPRPHGRPLGRGVPRGDEAGGAPPPNRLMHTDLCVVGLVYFEVDCPRRALAPEPGEELFVARLPVRLGGALNTASVARALGAATRLAYPRGGGLTDVAVAAQLDRLGIAATTWAVGDDPAISLVFRDAGDRAFVSASDFAGLARCPPLPAARWIHVAGLREAEAVAPRLTEARARGTRVSVSASWATDLLDALHREQSRPWDTLFVNAKELARAAAATGEPPSWRVIGGAADDDHRHRRRRRRRSTAAPRSSRSTATRSRSSTRPAPATRSSPGSWPAACAAPTTAPPSRSAWPRPASSSASPAASPLDPDRFAALRETPS